MKKLNIFLASLIIIFIFTMPVFSQDVEMSESAKKLAEKIKTEGGEAILEAGNSGDKSLIPYLRCLASKSKAPWSQIALAKLGDEIALKEITDEFNDEIAENDWNTSKRGMYKLSMVGGKVAFKKFYEILNQLKPLPKNKTPSSLNDKPRKLVPDNYEIYVYGFLTYLARMVKDPPKLSDKSYNPSTDKINMWKKWFEEHKELIE